ncbi:MAG TPA: prolipoprotein diacylglyceryl transferase [Coriobacteriia bacterium]|nr:prolipoprotein diacylglyceryl transferase [Coriobacteriia bacterium]
MIPDSHVTPDAWGVRPVLFSIGRVPVSSYSFFVLLGLVAAIALYFYNTRGRRSGHGLAVATAALVGGIIGAKVPIWLVNLPKIIANPSAAAVLSGRTIVGGLIGGALAVWLVKRRLGIRERLGNYLVPSLALGIFFGRLGCYFTGCCYGVATKLPWGVDFGDQIARHPTQLYEAAFALVLLAIAQLTLDGWAPGVLFRAFMIVYFVWRFAIEFIRVNPASALGLTYYQLAAAAVVLGYGVRLWLSPTGEEPR